jgi:hypothetical protein
MEHLTPSDQHTLEVYIRTLADQLGLRDWEIDLDEHLPDVEDAVATCWCVYGRRSATISVCERFRRLSATRQRVVIVHELLHCHFEHCSQIVREDAALGSMRREEAELLDAAFTRAFEYGIDATAVAIAPKFPLIQWSRAAAPKPAQKPAKKPKRKPA